MNSSSDLTCRQQLHLDPSFHDGTAALPSRRRAHRRLSDATRDAVAAPLLLGLGALVGAQAAHGRLLTGAAAAWLPAATLGQLAVTPARPASPGFWVASLSGALVAGAAFGQLRASAGLSGLAPSLGTGLACLPGAVAAGLPFWSALHGPAKPCLIGLAFAASVHFGGGLQPALPAALAGAAVGLTLGLLPRGGRSAALRTGLLGLGLSAIAAGACLNWQWVVSLLTRQLGAGAASGPSPAASAPLPAAPPS